MQIGLVKGRLFNSADEQGSPSVIVSQTLERQFWPNEDPIRQNLAMFLGVIGIYGVMSHLVSRRTHEIGIRVAMGATPSQVLRMVISHGLKLALIGISVGLLVALGATRGLAAQLYQVTPYDPPTFISVALLFALVVLGASAE